MKLLDIEAQAKAIAPLVRGLVEKAVQAATAGMLAVLDERLVAQGKEFAEKLETIPALDAEAVAKQAAELIPAPEKGEAGESIDITTVQLMVEESVIRAMESLELPKDGDPGKDAAELDILPRIEDGKSYARGSWATHNGGLWRAHATTDGMRGWECVVDGVQAFHVEQIDARNFAAVSVTASGKEHRQEFAMPAMIYKDIWKEGSYQKGDTVTWGGSLWHCDEDTDTKPGEGSKCWTLCAKKGRDAK